MFTCPMCKAELAESATRCNRCQADVSLLSQFISGTSASLARADEHRRRGELAAAVQGYFDVLDVDPANVEARAALGPILRAIPSLNRLKNNLPISVGWLVLCGVAIFVAGIALGIWIARYFNF